MTHLSDYPCRAPAMQAALPYLTISGCRSSAPPYPTVCNCLCTAAGAARNRIQSTYILAITTFASSLPGSAIGSSSPDDYADGEFVQMDMDSARALTPRYKLSAGRLDSIQILRASRKL